MRILVERDYKRVTEIVNMKVNYQVREKRL